MFKPAAPKFYTPTEALRKIAEFCAYQERYQKEVESKLRSYGLNEDEAGEIIIRLSREKLLDEERFAQAYVRGHYSQTRSGAAAALCRSSSKKAFPTTASSRA